MDFHRITYLDINIINSCIELGKKINKLDNMNNPIFNKEDFYSSTEHSLIYYATENNQLIGFIGVSILDDVNIELCGFVLHKYRNQKVASRLLEMVFDDYNDFQITIPIAINNSLGKNFLQSYNGKYKCTECVMELEKKDYYFTCEEINVTPINEGSSIIFKAFVNKTEVGRACVYNDRIFTIHNVEIYQQYKRNHYGQALLNYILDYQFSSFEKAIIHVTKENAPAFNLYNKLGFKIMEQVEYYSL